MKNSRRKFEKELPPPTPLRRPMTSSVTSSFSMAQKAMEVMFAFIAVFSCFHLSVSTTKAKLPGMLFPRDSESREVKDLSGFWNFRADMSANRNAGFEQSWFAKPLWQVGS